MSDKPPRLILKLYPRDWRKRYGEEVVDLFEEMLVSGESTRSRLDLGLLFNALRERVRSWHGTRRRAIVTSMVALVVLSGAALAVVGTRPSSQPNVPTATKGRLPQSLDVSKGGSVDLQEIPDFIAVIKNNKIVGYAPKRDLFGSQLDTLASTNPIVPVYGSDLKTLVGHMYPGVGFVAVGESPESVPCMPASTTEGTIPCPAVLVTMPDVVGKYTPTAAAAISQLGLDVRFIYIHTLSVPAGDIAAASPPPGTRVHARSVITLRSSIGP